MTQTLLRLPSLSGLLPFDSLSQAAACLKVMAHPMRLRIVEILTRGDFSVREIAQICEMKEHQVCGHLRLMQSCGLLTSERRGQSVYYKIASPQLPSLLECVRKNCGTNSPKTASSRKRRIEE